MKIHRRRGGRMRPTLSIFIALLFSMSAFVQADKLDESRKVIDQANQQLKKDQGTINTLDNQREDLLDEFRTTLHESDTYTTYNKQLTEIVQSQLDELHSLEQQIEEIEVTSKQIMPLMERMIDTLEKFVLQDLPFLPEERTQRIAKLRDNMIKADISVAEKYRKILEAYQVEIEYGKTLEAYQGPLHDKNVEFIKIGRTAFFYQSLDKSDFGVWDKHAQIWESVNDADVKRSISMAIKIARKQQSPELLTILASKVEAEQ